MDAFNPENDLIDRYLRGELQGKQLEDFLRTLENDQVLKKEVEFRQLLVQGIQEHGGAQLKNFIKQRTAEKRGLKVGFRNWYYAAAAIGLILIGSTVVFYNLKQNNPAHDAVANSKQETIQATPSENGIPSGPSESSVKQKSESPTIADNLQDNMTPLPGTSDANGSAESSTPEDIQNSNTFMPIASMAVIPIRIDSPMERANMSTKGAGSQLPVKKRKTAESDSDSAFDDNAVEKVKTQLAATNKFKLNFYNTKDATPQVSTNSKDPNNTEILVYNLPYDNPLLFTYQNKMYLRTGNKYYEIDITKDGTRKVTAVTDQALLKVLNQ